MGAEEAEGVEEDEEEQQHDELDPYQPWDPQAVQDQLLPKFNHPINNIYVRI